MCLNMQIKGTGKIEVKIKDRSYIIEKDKVLEVPEEDAKYMLKHNKIKKYIVNGSDNSIDRIQQLEDQVSILQQEIDLLKGKK